MNEYRTEKSALGSLSKYLFEGSDDLDIDEVAIAERALAIDEMFDSKEDSESLLETRALDQLFKTL
tara:strand:- start:1353 stop:1550 length:198 start_codon:yes stop_codon:yes gene_type:complete